VVENNDWGHFWIRLHFLYCPPLAPKRLEMPLDD
jgi:hypothetical protein